jgi:uncharacterized protein YndB with AHSA1/START domain
MSSTINNTVVIHRPVEEVFAFVTDPSATPRWQPNLVRSELLTQGPLRSGSSVKEARRVGPWRSGAIWQVTEFDPPHRRGYTYPTGFGPIRQSGLTTFVPVGGGTRVEFTATLEAAGALRLLLPLLARLMAKQNDQNFTRLKQLLESGVAAAAGRIDDQDGLRPIPAAPSQTR